MRFIRFFFLAVMLSFTAPVSSAQAGLIDFLFPVREGPSPSETLRAPFADDDAVIEELDASGNALSAMHLRHRTNAVMTAWIQETLPALLSYTGENYEREFKEKATLFTPQGRTEYVSFLQNSSFLTTLKTRRYNINGFVKDYPIVLNEGSAEGRYRWVYQVNVMATFLDGKLKDYKNVNESSAISKEYVLTFQLGRSEGANNEHGVLIETWGVKARPAQ